MNRHQQRHNTTTEISKILSEQNAIYFKIEKLISELNKLDRRLTAIERVINNF